MIFPNLDTAFGVVVLGIVLRFLYLGADPHYYSWIGYITDEGRWTENARTLYLDGVLSKTGNAVHFLVAPLFELANYVSFLLAGLSRTNSRIFTAACGSIILLLFWLKLRQKATPQALFLGVTFLALQADLLMLSRVAIPEMPVMLFELLVYFAVTSPSNSRWRSLLTGLLLIIGVAAKLTMVLFLPVAAAIILTRSAKQPDTPNIRQKGTDLALFCAGCAVPGIMGILVFCGLTGTSLSEFTRSLQTVTGLISVSDPFNMVNFFFDSPLSPTIHLWSVGLWLSWLAWISADRTSVHPWYHRHAVSGTVWFVSYLVTMQLLSYFPLRYKVHLLIPMALLLTVGLSIFQKVGLQKIMDAFAQSKGLSRCIRSVILSVPTAAIASPLLVSCVGLAGGDPGRLAVKLVCLSAAIAGVTVAAYQFHKKQGIVRALLGFPVSAAFVYFVSSGLSPLMHFWPGADITRHIVLWTGFLALAVTALYVSIKVWAGSRWITVAGVCYLVLSMFQLYPGYWPPNYTITTASRDLGVLLQNQPSIAVHRAEGMFTDNTLHYTTAVDWERERPAVVVAFENFNNAERLKETLKQEYFPLKSYELYVSEEYYRLNGGDVHTPNLGAIVTIYARKSYTAADLISGIPPR